MAHYDGFYHYLPVNDDAMRWGLYLTGAGSGTIAAGEDYPPVSHPGLYNFRWSRGRVLPEFQLILITDGQGVFESEQTGAVPVKSGSVVFLFPGLWHRYRPDDSMGWRERWISLNGFLCHRLLDLSVLSPETAVRQMRSPQSVGKLFDQLLDQIHQEPVQNSILLSLDVLALVGGVIKNSANQPAISAGNGIDHLRDPKDQLVADALEFIWTHSHRVLSVQSVADRLSINRRSLERRFQKELGRTVLEEISACRLSRAKRLLSETDLAVKMVAYLAGFASGERMRVSFLQAERMSPSEYRSQSLQGRNPKLGRPPIR